MRRSYLGWIIGFAALSLGLAAAIPILECNTVANLCHDAKSRVENAEEAINAVRAYHGTIGGPDLQSKLRPLEIFQSDGFDQTGGWGTGIDRILFHPRLYRRFLAQ
jgi:hypothetical protein